MTGECKRPNACCMVRVQGGEARLQAPAAHPIRAGLASRERLGFKGQARPLIDGVWGERSLPDGAAKAQCLMRANGERDATGERSVSFAKIAGVVRQTSCSTPYRVCSPLSSFVVRSGIVILASDFGKVNLWNICQLAICHSTFPLFSCPLIPSQKGKSSSNSCSS